MKQACSIALALIARADAQPRRDPPVADPHVADAARTVSLNAAVQHHNDAIAAQNAAAADAYSADLARFHVGQAENDRARAAAGAAADRYVHDRADYEAAMARWQAQRSRSNATSAAEAAPAPQRSSAAKLVCENAAPPGSHIVRRVCHAE